MNITRKHKAFVTGLVVAALAVSFPRQSYALFGIGDVVFDPTSYATLGHIWSQDISNYAKLIESVEQLEKIYGNALQVYQLADTMSHSFSGPEKAQWITVAQMGMADYTHDKYGENRVWSEAVSGNPNQVPAAWQNATLALNTGSYLAQETPGQSAGLARLATIEAIDGSSAKCLQTISAYRGNSLANQLGPVLKLAIARADGTAAKNSEVQQLNILAAQQEQRNNEAMAQGQINACLVEQEVLANKIQRDNQAESMNMYAQVQQTYANNPMELSNVSTALKADIQ